MQCSQRSATPRRAGPIPAPARLYTAEPIHDDSPMAAPSPTPSPGSPLSPTGMALATGCYLGWGLTPIYWKGITGIPADEVLIPRVLWTLVLLLVASAATGRLRDIGWGRGREWLWSATAAGLLAANWTLFIYAVQTDRVIATSLGYYINPLMSILMGMLLLGERLNRIQGLAVGIAALGVAALTLREGQLPWISLVLATSFALYGLIHKVRPQPPLAGLTREMLILAPVTLLGLAYLASFPLPVLDEPSRSALLEAPLAEHAYLALAGLVTAGPLLLFHAATKRLPLVAVGMFQYIAPTLTLGLATALYGEAFTPAHATGFGLVWCGLILFTIDSLRRARAGRALRASARTPA